MENSIYPENFPCSAASDLLIFCAVIVYMYGRGKVVCVSVFMNVCEPTHCVDACDR